MAETPGHAAVPVAENAMTSQLLLPSHVTMQPSEREKQKLNLFQLGILEVVLGSIVGIFSIVAVIVCSSNSYCSPMENSAPGTWCGAFLIASGLLGIKAKYRASTCVFVANMVMSILAACFMAVLVIMSAHPSSGFMTFPLNVFIAVAGGIGGIVAIVHSAFCCAGIRKQGAGTNQVTLMQLPQQRYVLQPQQMMQPQPQQFLVQVANNQFMFFPSPASNFASPICYAAPPAYEASLSQGQSASSPSMDSDGVRSTRMVKEQGMEVRGAAQSPPAYSQHPEDQTQLD